MVSAILCLMQVTPNNRGSPLHIKVVRYPHCSINTLLPVLLLSYVNSILVCPLAAL